jgi:hypothetical protein
MKNKNTTSKVANKITSSFPLNKPLSKSMFFSKKENKEATGTGAAGGYQPLFTTTKGQLSKTEAKEATGSASSGQYSQSSIWANSTNKKDWRGASKTQIPGGKFVQVKKKCKTFPYCNQGDINSLKIFENKQFKKAVTNLSKKYNLSENVVKNIIVYEYNLIP